jgi:ZIP family zinc transporter/zinc and cadmium transporter
MLVVWRREIAIRYSHYVNSFAAGALLTIALAHLIPEAEELADNALLVVLASFIVFYLVEAAVVFHSGSAIHFHNRSPERYITKGPVIFSGLFLHSLIDGFIIAIGFKTSIELGLFTAAGVILHELPEGVTSFALMLRSMKRKRAFILSVAVALATPVGTLAILGPLYSLSGSSLGVLMATAGGSFLYVAASDLIPETHEEAVLQNVVSLLAGAGFIYLLTLVFE